MKLPANLFQPSDRQLRQFGFTACWPCRSLPGSAHGNLKLVAAAAAAGALLAVSGFFYPRD